MMVDLRVKNAENIQENLFKIMKHSSATPCMIIFRLKSHLHETDKFTKQKEIRKSLIKVYYLSV